MQLISYFKRLSDAIDRIVTWIVFIAIAGMILTITLQIITRVFFEALTWSEELSRYLLVWSSFFAATLAYKRGMHISVTFGIDRFPQKFRKYFIIFSIMLSMIFFAVSMNYGFKLMSLQAVQVSAALRLPMRWVYLAIPVSFLIMIIHGVSAALEECFSSKGGNS